MRITIFGLSVSSSWGNGHATLWRGLIRSLAAQGHTVRFFEKDAPWYACARDLLSPEHFELTIYPSWEEIRGEAQEALRNSDAAIITSYCPDAIAATEAVLDSAVPAKVFYDLDSPVTLTRHKHGLDVEWLTPSGYREFDLVLSYSGGRTLDALRRELKARDVRPLYGSVDPDVHRPVPGPATCALSYLGTYAADRQPALENLFITPARHCPELRFLLGGSQYPNDFPWTPNIFFRSHVAPEDHNAFYCSANLTLNITRKAMVDYGHCPSGRLFESAACGVACLSDHWAGIDEFFEPGSEILVADRSAEAIAAISQDPDTLKRLGRAARERVLSCHTSAIRAREMSEALEQCMSGISVQAGEPA